MHLFHSLVHLDIAVRLQQFGFDDVLVSHQEGSEVLVVEAFESARRALGVGRDRCM